MARADSENGRPRRRQRRPRRQAWPCFSAAGSRKCRAAANPAGGCSPPAGPQASVKVWSAPKGSQSPTSGSPGGPLLPTSISRRLLWDRPGRGPIRASCDSCRPGAGRVGPGVAGVVESCGADSPGAAAAAGANDEQTTRVQGAGRAGNKRFGAPRPQRLSRCRGGEEAGGQLWPPALPESRAGQGPGTRGRRDEGLRVVGAPGGDA